jgi:pimeloyl-ACP methyl ester carboxylesterase
VALERIADALLTPDRGEPAASTIPWDTRETLDTPQGAIAYWTIGSGPAVLLVHGWEGWHAQMDAFVAPLLARGARVVSVDLPAHGESGGVTASPLDCGAAIAAVGAQIGPLAGAIGHSGGCPSIAIAMRGGMRLQRVALIATPERWERYVRWFAQEEGVDAEHLIDTLRAVWMLHRSCCPRPHRRSMCRRSSCIQKMIAPARSKARDGWLMPGAGASFSPSTAWDTCESSKTPRWSSASCISLYRSRRKAR